jgi:hypothetical protein
MIGELGKASVRDQTDHRLGGMDESSKGPSPQPLVEVLDRDDWSRPWPGKREYEVALGARAGLAEQASPVGIAAHHPVEDHQIEHREGGSNLDEVPAQSRDAFLQASLYEQARGWLLPIGGKIDVGRPLRQTFLQHHDLDLTKAASDLED